MPGCGNAVIRSLVRVGKVNRVAEALIRSAPAEQVALARMALPRGRPSHVGFLFGYFHRNLYEQ
jgi:hypothetical protein